MFELRRAQEIQFSNDFHFDPITDKERISFKVLFKFQNNPDFKNIIAFDWTGPMSGPVMG